LIKQRTANIGLLPACNVLASPINKKEFVVGLGRKSFKFRRPAASRGRCQQLYRPMQKLTLILFLTLLSGLAKSQNIYSALQLNAEREYKTKRPKRIVETNTFFNSSGKHVDKAIEVFDDAGMLLTEERYDDNGTLKSRLTYTNDTVHKIKLSRVFERWTQFGYSKETAFYTYDKNFFLIGTTDKDENGNVLRQTNLLFNDKGHPIELSLFDGNGNSFGKETATYLYDKNRVVTSVVANDGRLLSRTP
jgi:hypothetical protein